MSSISLSLSSGQKADNSIVSFVHLCQFLYFGLKVILEALVRLAGSPAQAPA